MCYLLAADAYRFTAVANSIGRPPESMIPNRCLPFDGTPASWHQAARTLTVSSDRRPGPSV